MVEQQELIPIHGEDAKAIKAAAAIFSDARRKHEKTKDGLDAAKLDLIEAIKDAEIEPNPDGSYRISVDGIVIRITPGTESVNVKKTGDKE